MWNSRLAPLAFALALTACAQASAGSGTGGEPPAGPVDVAVDTAAGRAPISPFVYGFNGTGAGDSPAGTTWLRLGGNRWTTYNWETNWSNAGSDYGFHNDLHLGAPADGVAHAAVPALAYAKAGGMGFAATIPMQGWVAADARDEGTLASVTTVDRTGATVATAGRFLPNRPAKGSAFSATPSTTDGSVYQDELAWYLASRWAGAATPLHLELDNEPDLWFETHREVQPSRISYQELLSRSVASAAAIKEAAPGAVVLGPVSYGWNGYVYLQDAPDKSTYGDFLDHYLDRMAAASATAGRRLLDVLDLHYYTEAESPAGTRVTAMGGAEDNTTPAVVAARVQSARSLAAGYVESSWIVRAMTGGQAVALIPRMLGKIAARYPGTKLALTEYNFGGENHVSGAVVQADALGLFGREGLYAGAFWPLTNAAGAAWAQAAWRAYRNYDGAGSSFGDTSVQATSTDLDHLAVYASISGTSTGKVVLVLIHRPTVVGGALERKSRTVRVALANATALGTARAWQLTAASRTPARLADQAVTGNSVTFTLPAMSVTTVELTP